MIQIYAFPASYGESILVSIGENEIRKNILIDAGFISTYKNHIKNKLIELNKENLILDLLIFTHFDADHISGGIKLLEENVCNKQSKIIHIDNIWINRLKHMEFNCDKQISISDKNKKILQKILHKKYPIELYNAILTDISAEQCLTLSKLIDSGEYSSNENVIAFSDSSDSNIFYLDENIKITILSPTKEKLSDLKKIWIEELFKMGIDEQLDNSEEVSQVFEKVMVNIIEKIKMKKLQDCSSSIDIINKIMSNDIFKEDESTVNGSSIAFIVEYKQKRILFLGDSHPSIIEKYIKEKLQTIDKKRVKFDLINLSHHGSRGNTSSELLKLVDCSKFLICTNGKKFNHPDQETLARIVTSNEGKYKEIYLNYKTNSIKRFLSKEMMKKYNYSIEITNKISTSNKDSKTTYIKL